MKISYKIVGGTPPAWVTLFDNATGDASPVFKPSFRNVNQLSQGFGAGSQAVNPLANAICSLNLPFSKTYTSNAVALLAIRTLRSNLSGVKVHLSVIEGSETQYYPNGSLENMDANLTGCSVDFNMTFQTEDVTGTMPST